MTEFVLKVLAFRVLSLRFWRCRVIGPNWYCGLLDRSSHRVMQIMFTGLTP